MGVLSSVACRAVPYPGKKCEDLNGGDATGTVRIRPATDAIVMLGVR